MINEEKFLKELSEILETDEDEITGKEFFTFPDKIGANNYSSGVLSMIVKVKILIEERQKELKFNNLK